jgi:predicted ATP-dependent serine protease
MDLQDLEKLIADKAEEGYELFIVDSLSRIHGNTDGQNSRGYQNKCMEDLQEMVQKLDIAIVLLHHTNKFGKFE